MSDSSASFRALAAECRRRAVEGSVKSVAAAPGDYALYKLIVGYGAREV